MVTYAACFLSGVLATDVRSTVPWSVTTVQLSLTTFSIFKLLIEFISSKKVASRTGRYIIAALTTSVAINY